MAKLRLKWWGVLWVLIVVTLSGPSLATGLTQATERDETEVRAVVKRFYERFQRKDYEGLVSLWSRRSPDLAASQQEFRRTFAATVDIELEGLTFGKVELNGDKATVRVVVEMSAKDAKTGAQAEGLHKMNRNFHLAKEGEEWKIWSNTSREQEIAALVAAAETEQERKDLLDANRDLV